MVRLAARSIALLPALWFVAGSAFMVVLGLKGVLMTDSALDIPIHDTYFVIPYSGVILPVLMVFVFFGTVYWAFPRMFKRRLDRRLGLLHFIMSMASLAIMCWPFLAFTLTAPRRYYTYSEFPMFPDVLEMTKLAAGIGLLAQLIFVYNIVRTLRGPRTEAP